MQATLTKEPLMAKKPYGDKSRYNVFDFGNEPWDQLPDIFPVFAAIINDGKFVRFKLPKDFHGISVTVDKDPKNDWNWLLYISSDKSARRCVGTTGDEAVVDFPVEIFLPDFVIRKEGSASWNSRRIGDRIFIGRIPENLSTVSAKASSYVAKADRRVLPKLPGSKPTYDEDKVGLVELNTEQPKIPDSYEPPVKKAETLSLSAFKEEPTKKEPPMAQPQPVPQPQPPKTSAPAADKLRDALSLINAAVMLGQLELKMREDGTIGGSITTRIEL